MRPTASALEHLSAGEWSMKRSSKLMSNDPKLSSGARNRKQEIAHDSQPPVLPPLASAMCQVSKYFPSSLKHLNGWWFLVSWLSLE
jgi:hypothetical protein